MYKQQIEEEKTRIENIKVNGSTPRSTNSTDDSSVNEEEEELPPSYSETSTPRSINSEQQEEEKEEQPPSYTNNQLDLPDVALDLLDKIPTGTGTANKKDILKELEEPQNKKEEEEEEEEEMFDLSKLKKGSSAKKLK